MDANKRQALASALAQIERAKQGEYTRPVVSVKLCGPYDEAPQSVVDELAEIIGRPVSINWTRQDSKPRNNTGVITDGRRYDEGEAVARYYEDAARRGARTGD